MTIKDSVKITNIATCYLYNFMSQQCNVPIIISSKEQPRKKGDEKKKREIVVKGGYVFDPHMGIYDDIGVVDFQSLYPNIIIRHGIMKGNVSRVSTAKYELNATWYKKHFYTIIDDEEKKWWYLSLKNNNDDNPIQLLFKHLIKKRQFFEKQINCGNNNNSVIFVKMIKLITNAIYGFYYLSHIPLLYDPLSACIITRYGRHYLKKAEQFILKRFPGTKCLYGDTDSLFLSSPHSLRDIVQFYNNSKKHYLKLKIEFEFQRLILIRKKQYIGKYYNNDYKFSGFPHKGVIIPPKMYELMKSILIQALEEEKKEEKRMMIAGEEEGGDDDDEVSRPPPPPLPSSFTKIIQTFLKEARDAKPPPTEYYQIIDNNNKTFFKLVPKKNNNNSKNNNYCCLIKDYDSSIHKIDARGTILYYLEKILNPLITTILKHPPLSDILTQQLFPNNNNDDDDDYSLQQQQQLVIKKKYLSMGYRVLDFSSNYYQQQHSLSIKFNRIYFKKNFKIQTFWESSSLPPLLSIYITFHEDGAYATIDNTLFEKSPQFYSLQSLEQSLVSVFEYDKYNYLLRNHHIQLVCSFHNFSFPLLSLKLFLQFVSGTRLNNNNNDDDDDDESTNLLCLVRNYKGILFGIINDEDVLTL